MRDNIKGGALTETTFLILLAVAQPNHGYGIMQFIENETGGRVQLGAGTLYGALSTLVKKKWIIPCSDDKSERKKEYIITPDGKSIVENEINRMKQVYHTAIKIMGGNNHE